MKEKKVNIGILIIIILAILVGIGTYTIFSPRMATIYLFNNNYAIGTKLQNDMLIPMQVNSSMVNAMSKATEGENNYITEKDLEKYLNKELSTDATIGMPCMEFDFGGKGGNKGNVIETKLDKDKMAISLPADSIVAGNPNLKQGSRVNVLTAFELQNGAKVSNIDLQNIRVMDVIKTNDENKEIKGVTLEVTPNQAEALNFAIEYGKVRLAIVKAGTYKDAKVQPYSVQDIKVPTPATTTQTK